MILPNFQLFQVCPLSLKYLKHLKVPGMMVKCM